MRASPLLLVVFAAGTADAQAKDSVQAAAVPRSVTGVVWDSVAKMPLVGATVQLVAADNPARFTRTAPSNILGRFTLNDIPAGRYIIGFFHPVLDSIGVQAPLREVHVAGDRPVMVDVAIPSPARLAAAICGIRPDASPGAVLVGIVREARDGSPASGVTVTGEWMELSFKSGKIAKDFPKHSMTTGDNGWFAMCELPSLGAVSLMATRGADSTDLIEIEMPAHGFVRHELYLGAARTTDVKVAATRSNRSPTTKKVHVGDGKLSGTVVAAVGGAPLANAQVSVADGPATRTNERGEFTLSDAPVGTRMLEVRALGYYPDRRLVHVVPDAPSVRVSLATLKAVLDTVRVRGSRLSSRDRSGFADRKRTGPGRYWSAADIARRPAVFSSDIFRSIPGIRIGYASDTLATDMVIAIDPNDVSIADRRLLMRGIAGDWCAPAIYLDGQYMPSLGADAIDSWIRPNAIAGIEVYSEATVPNDFMKQRSGCGSIVIWRK